MLLVSDSSSLYRVNLWGVAFSNCLIGVNCVSACLKASKSLVCCCLVFCARRKWCRCCRVFSMRKKIYLKVAIRHVIMSHKNSSDRTISIFFPTAVMRTRSLCTFYEFSHFYIRSFSLSLFFYLVSVVSDKTLISHNSSASGGPNDSKTSKFNQGEWWNVCARPGISH